MLKVAKLKKPIIIELFSFSMKGNTPLAVGDEIDNFIESVKDQYSEIFIIAISVGAYYAMSSRSGRYIKKALFISPIIDFVFLLNSMMEFSGVTEDELEKKKIKKRTNPRENQVDLEKIPSHS